MMGSEQALGNECGRLFHTRMRETSKNIWYYGDRDKDTGK